MQRILLASVFCGLCALLISPVQAQVPSYSTRALNALNTEARQFFVEQDSILTFRTRPVAYGRLDVDHDVLRAVYRIQTTVARAATPEETARSYLRSVHSSFGWPEDLRDLEVRSVRTGRYASHIEFQQILGSIPVYKRYVKVNLDRDGQPTLVLSGYAPHLRRIQRFDHRPTLSERDAVRRVQLLGNGTPIDTGTANLVVYPSDVPRLAWQLLAWPATIAAEWEVLIDAHTGELIHILDQSTHRNNARASAGTGPTEYEKPSVYATAYIPFQISPALLMNQTDGSGYVFDPDPLSSAGVDYGWPYVDNDDADLPELNAERIEVTLRDITQGNDGLYRLEGPFVMVTGSPSIGGTSFLPPAEANPHGFRYGRASDFFEAVMVYYHIDKSQRYLQLLDIGFETQNVPILVNPHGLGTQDNSIYYPGKNAIAFGDGGIDDAEDVDVILHEYAHALLEGSASGLLGTAEGRAFHEGWADYWAASYSRYLFEEEPSIPAGDWRKLFSWDGNTECWHGRMLTHDGHYPDDMDFPGDGCVPLSTAYQHGLLWATTLMEIYPQVGRTVLDRLNLASHAYLVSPVTFRDAAEALIQADIDLYQAAHADILLERLGNRGFIDPSVYGPIITHTPLASSEQVGGTITVEVEAPASLAPISNVTVIYGIDSAPSERLDLEHRSAALYSGELPIPSESARIYYYIEAVDESGLKARLPEEAPTGLFTFTVGPDITLPTISHEAPPSIAVGGWPLEITARVTDNLGVDSVWVAYVIERPDGTTQTEGSFELSVVEDDFYQGSFPVPSSDVEVGSVVLYRLFARDIAIQQNEATLPNTEMFSVTIVGQGVLRAYTFEGVEQGIQTTGQWERAIPSFGLKVAHSGEHVWTTNPGEAYADTAILSSMELPPINLKDIRSYLVFWHWYDIEHNGLAEPDRIVNGVTLWDGANVKASTDGGDNWSVLTPEGGYNGSIEPSYNNPMGGEPGFGGYSYGWRREIIPLPDAEDVRIRFDFGSDSSNEDQALHFAGWFLDDVSITTIYPEDDREPSVLRLPPTYTPRAVGEELPLITVRVYDDVGIASVFADYIVYGAESAEEGRLRLYMSNEDLYTYLGTIQPSFDLSEGDRIEYRLRISDFDDNQVVYPALMDEPFLIEYLLTQYTDAFSNVRASGLWEASGSSWTVSYGNDAEVRSSLVLNPLDLPTNGLSLQFNLRHSYLLNDGVGGNIKISSDNEHWTLLAPDAGYTSIYLPDEQHPMNGEGIFAGSSENFIETTFDLSPYSGQQIRLRIDLGAVRALESEEYWTIEKARFLFTSKENTLEIPRELALFPNFPDPFDVSTTISYTLPEELPVKIEVYDMLGRRVGVLVDSVQPAQTYTVVFDRGTLASGVYILRLVAGSIQKVERMVIAR